MAPPYHPPVTVEPALTARDDRLRRRAVMVLFGGVALSAIGYIAAITVGTLAGAELGGGASWAGLPTAGAILGTAGGAALLGWIAGRHGRRPSLVIGYLTGALGATLAVVALLAGSLQLLIVAMLVVGLPNAAAQAARYVGGDMYQAGRRARAIGVVVWGATVGAVVGPSLIGPTGTLASGVGLPVLAGSFVAAAVTFAIAGVISLVLLRPDPAELVDRSVALPRAADVGPSRSMRRSLLQPNVSVAVVALISSQLVMVMVMTMTPLHLRDHGHDLAVVGVVMSAHTLGMFALAPLSGRLTGRFGSLAVIMAGFVLLGVASLFAALAPASGGLMLMAALFLLGFGWNLGFVASSDLLSTGSPLIHRARLQGGVDAAVWGTSAISSVVAGPLLDLIGYAGLAIVAAALTSVPALFVVARYRAVVPQAA